MADRAKFRNIDGILVGLLILNTAIGIAFIESSSSSGSDYPLRQLIFLVISLVLFFLALTIDYRILTEISPFLYGLLSAVLAGVLVFGRLVSGAKSWIRTPFFIQIQPSEIMKLAVILVLARLFAKHRADRVSFSSALAGTGLVLVPVLLIALQPDLGTTMSFLIILFAGLFLTGLNRRVVLILILAFLAAGWLSWNFALKDYQKQRVRTLIIPQSDPLATGYQIIQSKIAVGSGGLIGKGFQKGSQSQLRFLPARHTDFIFAVICEEMGFIGAVLVILIYVLMLLRIFQTVKSARDRLGIYIVYMVGIMIAFQFFINVFMTVGLFPIAGIPLPFISYGGSSLLTNYLAVSLVVNVKMRRFVNV